MSEGASGGATARAAERAAVGATGAVGSVGAAAPSTVGAWLEVALAGAPDALRERLTALLAPHADRPSGELPELCMHTGEALLAALMAQQATDRASALDLLAVDALFTYAFEAAADAPETLVTRAEAAMRRVAEIPGSTPVA